MRKTKIIATIGPATESPEALDALVAAGIDVARLNASHAGPSELAERLEAVRAAADRGGRRVAVMLDLAGPKLRVGEVESGSHLETGTVFTLTTGVCVGDSHHACVTYEGFAADLKRGNRVLLDDGRLELEVSEVRGPDVITTVRVGGELKSHKGVNVPGVKLGLEPVTRFDRAMAEWAAAKHVDYVAQSFVRETNDIHRLRQLLRDENIPIVAKIEKYEAAENINGIIGAADAIMVARGDLGVETSVEQVPVLQREIIMRCRAVGRPVIVATQMLESMTHSPRPTRAEASDVANAIFQRVDAVMLSAETAIGEYPSQTVATMARIAETAEGVAAPATWDRRSTGDERDITQAVSAAVCELAEDLRVSAIITATQTGATAYAVASHRPNPPIIAVTPSDEVARKLALLWGVQSVVLPLATEDDAALEELVIGVRDAGFVRPGERVAITAGVARGVPGGTDLLLVREVPA